MSLSRLKSLALIVPLALATAGLGACSFQPVYSGRLAANPQLDLAYAAPNTRLEQVLYAELSLRLGKTTSETAPILSAVVGASTGSPYLSATTGSSAQYETTVTATVTITPRDGADDKPVVITRTAKAQLTQNSQVLANTAAISEAEERATRAVAESLRLAILALLGRG